jgi:hypothetical protein
MSEAILKSQLGNVEVSAIQQLSSINPQPSLPPSAMEREAFVWMQGRMVELLLRHDLKRFGSTFGERQSALFDDETHPALQPYRELAVLFFLRDELFDSILPRIKRRLSFLAPREIVQEELPPRGRIDWSRTMAAGLRDRPGEPPLEVQTRQRRRHFATPENLLTVTTILEYRALVQQRLDDEMQQQPQTFQHPLHEIVDQCTRELAFPQFTGLVHHCRAIIDGIGHHTIADLEQMVADQLIPGRNSAYDDLLIWRCQLGELRLLDRNPLTNPTMLGFDPARDNYLYQVWMFYEFGDMLQRKNCIHQWDPGQMVLTYTWEEGAHETHYRLQHDQATLSAHDQFWLHAPGVRPDFYIQRMQATEIRNNGLLVWREDGYVLDAKYYKPHGHVKAPAHPIKRMLADLQLIGERKGMLLFAFQSGAAADSMQQAGDLDIEIEPASVTNGLLYTVSHNQVATHAMPHVDLAVWRVQPQILEPAATLDATITMLFETVHSRLSNPIPIACHGFLPDSDTINPSSSQPLRCPTCHEVLAFCPKPHVDQAHVDRVCPRCDCLRSIRLCHIKDRGTYTAPPFIKRVLTREDLFASITTLRSWLRESIAEHADDPAAEQARAQLLQTIGELTETYVKLTRADTAQTEHTLREWVFGEYWSTTASARGLALDARNMLISGEYVWLQFQGGTVEDWAACAVQYMRALEYEIHRRIYAPCGEALVTRDGLPMLARQFTLGTVVFLYRDRDKNTNWQTVLDRVAQPSGIDQAALRQLIIDINSIKDDRNKVAHTEHVNAALAQKIRSAVLGKQGEPGILYRLITQLQPARTS